MESREVVTEQLGRPVVRCVVHDDGVLEGDRLPLEGPQRLGEQLASVPCHHDSDNALSL